MITTLTYDEAVAKCPAISATKPHSKVSKQYAFIPTKDIVELALSKDWLIQNVKSRKSEVSCHQVSLIHKSQLSELNQSNLEGFPQVLITNSHDLTKRFSLSMGYFRLVCSNGLVAPTGLCSSISPTLHRQPKQGEDNLFDTIVPSLERALAQYNSIQSKIGEMKSRTLSDEEKMYLARYSHYIRFRYRMTQPQKFNFEEAIKPRRKVDETNSLWHTFNVIQENFTRGGTGIGRGITQFQDDLRFNQELWAGVDKALIHQGGALKQQLDSLFPKKSRPRKK